MSTPVPDTQMHVSIKYYDTLLLPRSVIQLAYFDAFNAFWAGLARSMDTTVTDSLAAVLRSADTGPKVGNALLHVTHTRTCVLQIHAAHSADRRAAERSKPMMLLND